MAVLLTGVAAGAAARWTSSVGGANGRTTTAFYRYDPVTEAESETELLLQAKEQFVKHLVEESQHPSRIQSEIHGAAYLYTLLDSVTAKVVKPGIIQLNAQYGGSAQQPQTTRVTSDTVMVYTKGGTNSLYPNGNFGFPDETLINQLPGEDPLNIDMQRHTVDALQRTPFTRSMISYRPTIIDVKGPFAQRWQDAVGRTNNNVFTAFLGDDYSGQVFGVNTVRLNGFQTNPKPLLSKDGGVAWSTTFDFTISQTQFVDQAIEIEDREEEDETSLKGKIVYLDQYERIPFPQFYTP
jgi:hypothetical protein